MRSADRRALVVAHESNGGSAVLGRALVARGWHLDEHVVNPDPDHPHLVAGFPSVDGYGLLVVMGSIHSVYDRAAIGAWIDDELELLRSAHQQGVPVLGVCFGAQALALALGGAVEPSPVSEIGWYRIDGENLPIDHGPWFQWHHDRLIPPPGAHVLASTPQTVQVFRSGTSVGTQFHPEVSGAHVATWLDVAPQRYLDECDIDAEHVLAETYRREAASESACHRLVDWFLALSA